MELEAVSWDEIYTMLVNLADRIKKDRFKPDVIVGVSRGGWPPARVLSDLLENPELANVKVEFYVGVNETKKEPVITQPISVPVKNKKVLVVDDVADTGRSLLLVRQHLLENGAKEVKVATIYYKPWSKIIPDYYERETNCWIVFPWERRETVRNVLEKLMKKGKTVEEVKEVLVKAGLESWIVEKFVKEALQKLEGCK